MKAPTRRRIPGRVKRMTITSRIGRTVKTMTGMYAGVSMMLFPPAQETVPDGFLSTFRSVAAGTDF